MSKRRKNAMSVGYLLVITLLNSSLSQ